MDEELRRLEEAVARRARNLWESVDQQEEILSIGSDWEDQLLDWAMSDADRKCRILRFIDAFPALRTDAGVVEHIRAYFPSGDDRLPLALRAGLKLGEGLITPRWVTAAARLIMRNMARRFIGGENSREAAQTLRILRQEGFETTLDFLGEETLSESEADRNLETILSTLEDLSRPKNARDAGQIHFSVKLSALTSWLDPIDPDEIARRLSPRLRTLFRAAIKHKAFIHIDGETYECGESLTDILLGVLNEPEFQSWSDVGVVIQAYLRDAEARFQHLNNWCGQRNRELTIRLVKGAYWDSEIIRSRRAGWAPPVYLRKSETDAAFERLALAIMKSQDRFKIAVASHNLRSLGAALTFAANCSVSPARLEFQFLYGMARATRRVMADLGHKVRVYTPYGELIPGMAYLVRRILENNANESFLRHRRLGQLPPEQLLKSPHDAIGVTSGERHLRFQNAPAPEFHKPDVRENMRLALRRCLEAPVETIGPVVNGRRAPVSGKIESRNPSHPSRVIAEAGIADANTVNEAVTSARRAWTSWRTTPVSDRANILLRAADLLLSRHDELSALIVCEAGKPWTEAQADVSEAADYFRYYALDAGRLDHGVRLQAEIPGEQNIVEYRPRGLAAVISPWNFPMAIPAGQIGAALASGNCVLFKPAEQTPLIAFRLFECLQSAGVPPGVLHLLPGTGEETGAALVDHPDVDLIAFTGSRAVGEEIQKRAAAIRTPSGPKRVIAEMGGKNAVIIDSDADLDLAVRECLASAFDYAGQKCSALSRIILLDDVFDAFVNRFSDAAAVYPIGYAETPSTRVSALIEEDAVRRVTKYIEAAERGGRWILKPDASRLSHLTEGYFVPPCVVAVDEKHTIAQEEIFGPVVAVIAAKSVDEAIAIANGTSYALTGGFFSRHPARIDRLRRELDVGNLYINRSITGALVGRQPFGGHRASGVGSKAGGPDYLAQFCIPVTVSENMARHGFSPDVSL